MSKQYQVNLVSGLGMTASTSQLATILKEHPERIDEIKKNPDEALSKLVSEAGNPAYYSDRWLYRWVAFALGLIILIVGIGAIILAESGKTTPDVLVALGSGAIGALAGLFAPTTRGKS